MDLLKTILIYMTMVYVSSVQAAPEPSPTPATLPTSPPAIAAPATPSFRPNIKSGSSAILSTPPAPMPSMESFVRPSQRRIVLITSEEHITGSPIKMYLP